MGIEQHHAVIVQGEDHNNAVERAHAIASTLFPLVSPILESGINGIRSFYIPPDGSKEGWVQSELGDERRRKFFETMLNVGVDVIEVTWGELGLNITMRD